MFSPLDNLLKYRKITRLDEVYKPEAGNISSEKEYIEIIDILLDALIKLGKLPLINKIPDDLTEKRRALRALLNIRPPGTMKEEFIKNIDRLLQHELARKTIFDSQDIPPVSKLFPKNRLKHPGKIFLWKGDITSLKTDAIINAANDRMLGCFQPLHNCIDNVIHSAAGPLLREDCKAIMDMQGRREGTGDAKITRGYNLPARFVIHTVGPIITGDEVTSYQQEQLASSYISSLSLAGQIGDIKSIAFPCISTGVFNFPQGLAAETAVETVDEWLENNPKTFTQIIFNVFLEEDLLCYERIFRG